MSGKKVIAIIVGVIVVAAVGAGAFYFLTKKDSNTDTATTNSTTSSSSQETPKEETPAVTLSGALSRIGATGNEGPVNGNTYTLNGVAYRFDEPSNWQTSLNQRKQACEQGYVNTSYQIVTDGSTWFATTDNNSDLGALATALKGGGINAEVASYC